MLLYLGFYVQDVKSSEVITIATERTVLANGDGIAMVWHASCCIANMEFIQFYPTCLYHSYVKYFLITENVRGKGGMLKPPQSASGNAGKRFMPANNERAELAPRDIDAEIKKRVLD